MAGQRGVRTRTPTSRTSLPIAWHTGLRVTCPFPPLPALVLLAVRGGLRAGHERRDGRGRARRGQRRALLAVLVAGHAALRRRGPWHALLRLRHRRLVRRDARHDLVPGARRRLDVPVPRDRRRGPFRPRGGRAGRPGRDRRRPSAASSPAAGGLRGWAALRDGGARAPDGRVRGSVLRVRGTRRTSIRRSLVAGIGTAIPLALLVAYNLATTGARLHPAYEHLYDVEYRPRPELYHPEWGIEDLRYIPQNAADHARWAARRCRCSMTRPAGDAARPEGLGLLFDRECPLVRPDPVGMSILLTSPAYLLAIPALAVRLAAAPRRRRRGSRSLAIALVDLAHFSQGWVQFGYRFSNDFAPFAVILVALGIGALQASATLSVVLVAASVLINAWGVCWGVDAGVVTAAPVETDRRPPDRSQLASGPMCAPGWPRLRRAPGPLTCAPCCPSSAPGTPPSSRRSGPCSGSPTRRVTRPTRSCVARVGGAPAVREPGLSRRPAVRAAGRRCRRARGRRDGPAHAPGRPRPPGGRRVRRRPDRVAERRPRRPACAPRVPRRADAGAAARVAPSRASASGQSPDRPASGRPGWLVAASVAFGLALGNHALTLLLVPGIAVYVLARRAAHPVAALAPRRWRASRRSPS